MEAKFPRQVETKWHQQVHTSYVDTNFVNTNFVNDLPSNLSVRIAGHLLVVSGELGFCGEILGSLESLQGPRMFSIRRSDLLYTSSTTPVLPKAL